MVDCDVMPTTVCVFGAKDLLYLMIMAVMIMYNDCGVRWSHLSSPKYLERETDKTRSVSSHLKSQFWELEHFYENPKRISISGSHRSDAAEKSNPKLCRLLTFNHSWIHSLVMFFMWKLEDWQVENIFKYGISWNPDENDNPEPSDHFGPFLSVEIICNPLSARLAFLLLKTQK